MRFSTQLRIVALLASVSAAPAFAQEYWAAFARDQKGETGQYSVTTSQSSKRKAELEALKACNSKRGAKCEIVGSAPNVGHVAVAESSAYLQVFIGDTFDDAKRGALQGCAARTPPTDVCEIKWTGFNGPKRSAAAQTGNADCRPRTPVIRCNSNCVNGDCIVTYENGCKIRVQVSPRFDGSSNQWTYPSPSC